MGLYNHLEKSVLKAFQRGGDDLFYKPGLASTFNNKMTPDDPEEPPANKVRVKATVKATITATPNGASNKNRATARLA